MPTLRTKSNRGYAEVSGVQITASAFSVALWAADVWERTASKLTPYVAFGVLSLEILTFVVEVSLFNTILRQLAYQNIEFEANTWKSL